MRSSRHQQSLGWESDLPAPVWFSSWSVHLGCCDTLGQVERLWRWMHRGTQQLHFHLGSNWPDLPHSNHGDRSHSWPSLPHLLLSVSKVLTVVSPSDIIGKKSVPRPGLHAPIHPALIAGVGTFQREERCLNAFSWESRGKLCWMRCARADLFWFEGGIECTAKLRCSAFAPGGVACCFHVSNSLVTSMGWSSSFLNWGWPERGTSLSPLPWWQAGWVVPPWLVCPSEVSARGNWNQLFLSWVPLQVWDPHVLCDEVRLHRSLPCWVSLLHGDDVI